MPTTCQLTADFADLLGADALGVVATIETNLPAAVALVDQDGNEIRMSGPTRITLSPGQSFDLTLIATDSPDINVIDGTLRYLVRLTYRDPSGNRRSWESGYFELTSDADLSDIAGSAYSAPELGGGGGGGLTEADIAVLPGTGNAATGIGAHAEGINSTASANSAHASGETVVASGLGSSAQGRETLASGDYSHAEGDITVASGEYSHAEGQATTASGLCAHAEGAGTTASGTDAHAEGSSSVASGIASHAEGSVTVASGDYSHAEGSQTNAFRFAEHAQGFVVDPVGGLQHSNLYSISGIGDPFAGLIAGSGTDPIALDVHAGTCSAKFVILTDNGALRWDVYVSATNDAVDFAGRGSGTVTINAQTGGATPIYGTSAVTWTATGNSLGQILLTPSATISGRRVAVEIFEMGPVL